MKNIPPKEPLSTIKQCTIRDLDDLNENFKASAPSADNPSPRVRKMNNKYPRVKIPSSHHYPTRHKANEI